MGLPPLLLVYLAASALTVLKGSYDSGDLFGSPDTDEGLFGCGIAGGGIIVDPLGIDKKEVESILNWLVHRIMYYLSDRGVSQIGLAMNTTDIDGNYRQIVTRLTNEKRDWRFWLYGAFYSDLFNLIEYRFYKALPKQLVPPYINGKFAMLILKGHNRLPTVGELDDQAPHPQSSPLEKRVMRVFDDAQKRYRKLNRYFQTTIAFNGDLYKNIIKNLYKNSQAWVLEFWDMRRFYAAAVHKYYGGMVTIGYLKKIVINGKEKEHEQEVPTNYSAVSRYLYDMGYIYGLGYVNREFKGLDREEFKRRFPKYVDKVANQIESALYGMASGDAPIIAMQGALLEAQGSGWAAARAASDILNGTVLFERQGRAVGRIIDDVYDQVDPFISRRGYTPSDPETARTFGDIYVTKEDAEKLGLTDQYEMLEIFRGMLDKRIQAEAQKATPAGQVFLEWEDMWARQGLDVGQMRRRFIEVAVEKFFTSDTTAAVMEFADRNEGEFGLYMTSSVNNSITFYKRRQGVYIGLNRTKNYFTWASSEDALKNEGRKGEKVEEVLKLKDGEVAKVSVSPSGKIIVQVWTKVGGKWTEIPQDLLEERYRPTAKMVNGEKNKYYAPPKHEFENPRQQLEEELKLITKNLAESKAEYEDNKSNNWLAMDNLAEQINETIKKHGSANVVVIAYGSCEVLSKIFEDLVPKFIRKNKLGVQVIDSNDFKDTTYKYVKANNVYLFVDDAGATASILDSLQMLELLVHDKRVIFGMTARADSQLLSDIQDDGGPEHRSFVLGQFFSSEALIAEDPFLAFQLILLAINLPRRLIVKDNTKRIVRSQYAAADLDEYARVISEGIVQVSKETSGYDEQGLPYEHTDKAIEEAGDHIGRAGTHSWWVNRKMDFLVFCSQFSWGSFAAIGTIFSYHLGGGFLATAVGAVMTTIWLRYILPFWLHNRERKKDQRPINGRMGPVPLLVVAPRVIAKIFEITEDKANQNKPASLGPLFVKARDRRYSLHEIGSLAGRGVMMLKMGTSYNKDIGHWLVEQVKINKTAPVGKKLKGSAEVMTVIVRIPVPKIEGPKEPEGASKNELIKIWKQQKINRERNDIIDKTVGFMGLLIASKKIVVRQVKITSKDGKLYNTVFSFAKARVISTRIFEESDEYRHLMDTTNKELAGVRASLGLGAEEDGAMISEASIRHRLQVYKPGGIDMNSRLMQLKVTGESQNRIGNDDNATLVPIIKGVVPQVTKIVTVTPDMLKAMLGTGYLN